MQGVAPQLIIEDVEILKRNLPEWQKELSSQNPSVLGLEARSAVSIKLAQNNQNSDLKGQVFSDGHLYTYSKLLNSKHKTIKIAGEKLTLQEGIDPTRATTTLALQKMNEAPITERPDILFFAGDTFEILGSCVAAGFVPQDAKGNLQHPDKIKETFKDILNDNHVFFSELRKFLKEKPNAKIVFNTGNHDHLLSVFGALRDILYKELFTSDTTRSNKDRIVFCDMAMCPELQLYIEHGHLLEDQSHSKYGASTMCDALTLACEKIPRAVISEIEKYETEVNQDLAIYPIKDESFKENFEKSMKVLKTRVENFLFIDKVPSIKAYLESCFKKTIKSLNKIKGFDTAKLQKVLEEKIYNRFGEIFANEGVIKFYHSIFANTSIKQFFAWAMGYGTKQLEKKLNSPDFQKKFLDEVNRKREKKGNNEIQVQEALRLKKLFPLLNFFSFGHTHQKNKNNDGDEYQSPKEKRSIRHFNTGLAHRNLESSQNKQSKWKFKQKEHNGSSLIVSRKDGAVSARTHSFDQLIPSTIA